MKIFRRVEETLLSRFEKGIVKFNSGEYYECHDILEDLWFDIRGSSRKFYQGLIHLAVGFHHIIYLNNPKGAISQLTKCIDKLSVFQPQYQGIELTTLLNKISSCIEDINRIKNGESDLFNESLIPRLEFNKKFFLEP